jgi:meso-butanediol dehydrogenase/(S,S)-butanediol dehydrogenase/diacetyl reductase
VTGGGSGIGAATARALSADGWSVVLAGRRAERVERVAGEVGGVAVVADVSRPTDAARAVEAALGHAGRLDALILSHGAGAGGAVLDQTLERFTHVVQTNLTGAFLLCQSALPALLAAGGAIVTVASLAGLRADPGSVAYCSSKAGLIMLTKCVAVDYGPRGVRANCVCPGWIETEMADAAMDELAGAHGVTRSDAYALAVEDVPARRPGRAAEAAAAIAFLASPAASYINGSVLTVDGGAAVVDAGTLAFAPHRLPGAPTGGETR